METEISLDSTFSKHLFLLNRLEVATRLLTAFVAVILVCSAGAQNQPLLPAMAAQLTNEGYSFVQIQNPPEFGTWWSMQLTNLPPWPVNPFPALPVYEWQVTDSTNASGQYFYDDLSIDYEAAGADFGEFSRDNTNRWNGPERKDAGPPSPGGGDDSTNDSNLVPQIQIPNYVISTNYEDYTNFWLVSALTNSNQTVAVALMSTLPGLTYQVWTNASLANITHWGLWQTVVATNATTVLPLSLSASNGPMFFRGVLVWSTCTNYSPALPDWWAELYFQSTACISPTANPAGDGIDNWDKYLLDINPNVAYLSEVVITPPGGNYINTPHITLFSQNGASMIYTTNGTMPGLTNGMTAASGVALTNLPAGNFTLKAWENGLVQNAPLTAFYSIIPAAPTFSIVGGAFDTNPVVQISSVTSNSVVRYTEDGTDPTTSSPEIAPTNFLTISGSMIVKAAAWLGSVESPVASQTYLVEVSGKLPEPPNDDFSNAITLTGASGDFSGTTEGATVEDFETNNYMDYFWPAATSQATVWFQWTAPSNGAVFIDCSRCYPQLDSFYPVPYIIPPGTNFSPTNLVPAGYVFDGDGSYESYGYETGPNYYENSDGTSYTLIATQNVTYYWCICYLYDPLPFDVSWEYVATLSAPVFSPPGGTYSMPQAVKISDTDTNVVIYYTLDGSIPTTNDATIASGAMIFLTNSVTVKAMAERDGLNESAIAAAVFTATTNASASAGAPSLSPSNETFATSLTVTLACTNAGGIIYYTLDGATPDCSSARVASGGTVTFSNSAIVSAVAYVTNMVLSPVVSSQYARDGAYTAGDGIPDTGKQAIGANILDNDANAPNPNTLAHGLSNLQVYENQEVLDSDNYSTLNDGIPDWWLIENGFSVTTLATTLGANGVTLLASYVGGLNPENPGSQPGELPPIDFHLVHGPGNSLVMVLDTVRPNMAGYRLICYNTDHGLPSIMEDFPATQSLDDPSQGLGRYFQMTNELLPGYWYFTLQGVNSNQFLSQVSSNTTTFSLEWSDVIEGFGVGGEGTTFQRTQGQPIPVVGYANKNSLTDPLLVQNLRAKSDVTASWELLEGVPEGYAYTPIIYNDQTPDAVVTNQYWGTLQYTFNVYTQDGYNPTNFDSYFTPFCATPDFAGGCEVEYTNSYYGGYSFPVTGVAPLQVIYSNDFFTPEWFVMPNSTWGEEYATNPVGLYYTSLMYHTDDPNNLFTLSPGDSNAIVNPNSSFEVALETETPTLQGTAFAFDGRQYPIAGFSGTDERSSPPFNSSSVVLDGWMALNLAESQSTSCSTTNPVIVAQVGRPVHLQGWEQMIAVHVNGQPITNNSFWVDQDFAQAYLCDPTTGDVPRTNQLNLNGVYKINTNAAAMTGILSPNLDFTNADGQYFGQRGADFTPTQTGKIIVTTMPDANGNYGEVTIYAIDMQVDANHDGTMDNRDLTSAGNPMTFWVNNDIDRGHTVDGTDWEQDDLNIDDSSLNALTRVPDSSYVDSRGPLAIPSQRDLEDYARLWIPGYSNMMASLPTNYGVILKWRNNTGAEIRIFRAQESDGGTNYLFDTNTAALQTNFSANPCYGYVSTNTPLDLFTEYRTWILAPPPNTDHYIFCGSSVGNDELVLQVLTPGGAVAGEASIFINLKDIKQMYERWSIGEDPTQPPSNIATNCGDQGVASTPYPYDPTLDSSTPYVLHVHGSNMETWEKDRFAETMFKRLYWQGYQGRFGSFRWPTSWGFTGSLTDLVLDRSHFDLIEYTAWQSATGLKNMLTRLNILYPGQVGLTAHSMGNIAAGEALRQATSTLVSFYGAFQGAGAAHCYDTNAPVIPINIVFDAGESNVYAHYWTPTNDQYFADAIGAANYVNFFNTNDAVLNYWLTGQKLKPDGPIGYSYSTAAGYFYNNTTPSTQLLFPGDTYKIFAFCQQAKCNCIGEQANLGGQFTFLGKPQQVELDAPPYSYGDTHKYHSAEFRSDNMSRAVFWNQLLIQMGLK